MFYTGSVTKFAILYSLGNIVALCSTCFLMGPVAQIKRMFSSSRWLATVLMLFFLVMTILSAVWWQKGILVLIFCICQFCSMIWYSISYIPYARDAVKKCVDGCISWKPFSAGVLWKRKIVKNKSKEKVNICDIFIPLYAKFIQCC